MVPPDHPEESKVITRPQRAAAEGTRMRYRVESGEEIGANRSIKATLLLWLASRWSKKSGHVLSAENGSLVTSMEETGTLVPQPKNKGAILPAEPCRYLHVSLARLPDF